MESPVRRPVAQPRIRDVPRPFFAHSCKSDGFVHAVARYLRTRHIDPYVAEWDDRPGLTIDQKTGPALEAADGVVVFWSKSGSRSDRVRTEYARANELGKPIALLLYDGVDRPEDWGDRIYVRVALARNLIFPDRGITLNTRIEIERRLEKYSFDWLTESNRRARTPPGPSVVFR